MLAGDLETAWQAPTTDMRTKQRLVRTLIEEIVIDVDDVTREVVLVIHWRGPPCVLRRLAAIYARVTRRLTMSDQSSPSPPPAVGPDVAEPRYPDPTWPDPKTLTADEWRFWRNYWFDRGRDYPGR